MQKIKSIIVGYGSIGKRHASIQKELGVDVVIVTKQKFVDEFKFYVTMQEALKEHAPDFIVIANETSLHLPTLKELQRSNFSGKIICEKPIGMNNFPLSELGHIDKNVFVAYNLRFHPLIQKIKDLTSGKKILTFLSYVGQYLPDWRPDTDYSKCYSAKKEMGGGVLRDLSHEIDFSNYLFGAPTLIKSFSAKVSDLKINTEDIANINWITPSGGIGLLSLNYLDKKVSRFLIVNTPEATYKIDFISNELWINNSVQRVEVDRNTTYKNMYRAFLSGQFSEFCTLSEGLEVMKIIEESAIN